MDSYSPASGTIETVLLCTLQDENWGETTTAVTNASDLDYAMEDLSKWQLPPEQSLQHRCGQWLGPACSATLALAAFLSPILMVALPHLGLVGSQVPYRQL